MYSWKYQSIETIIMISDYTGTRIYRCINKTELEPIYVTLTTHKYLDKSPLRAQGKFSPCMLF